MPNRSVVIAAARDPDGRQVVLDTTAWQHIMTNHPEMRDYQSAILLAVQEPDYRRADPRPGRERFYRQGIGPSRWCLAVVDFMVSPARLVTAFGLRRDPEGWQQ